ncbi:MAG TPA: efflux RND transporter periplasmic adaptor subunit, partial [Mucilaginibacter sp.]|nr:efflux RND transporter periplasmic adaptor subunit [Mucilaginibacter sp.]
GQVLGTIKSAEVANYNSALIAADANVQQTQRQLTQQKDMYKSGLVSEVDVTNAKAAYDQAVAAKIAAQKVLSINGNNKNGEYAIKSPIDGFIVQMNVASGTSIRSDNNAGLFTISDLKNVWVQANVYEQNIGQVHEGNAVKVTTVAYPDKVFEGRVDKLMNVLDPTTKTMKMRVVLQNPDYLLKPQMFVTVTLEDKENKTAIAISSKALVFDNSQYYVLVVNGKKSVQIRPVEILSNNGVNAYIKSGLQPGDRIVASNALLIYGTLNT